MCTQTPEEKWLLWLDTASRAELERERTRVEHWLLARTAQRRGALRIGVPPLASTGDLEECGARLQLVVNALGELDDAERFDYYMAGYDVLEGSAV